jgi:hypothetical protein
MRPPFGSDPSRARRLYYTTLHILTLGYYIAVSKNASEAARLLAQKSVRARRERWGEREFVRRMREWGKLGGRPLKKGDSK